jgi:hypothetical protein
VRKKPYNLNGSQSDGMNERLIRKLDDEAFLPSEREWEPVFFDCQGRLCPTLPSPSHAERFLAFLKHAIFRRPNDLVAHVRRILIARAHRQKKIVGEALQDLFHVLGNRGQGLRKHLLALCAPFLDEEILQRLQSPIPAVETNAIVIRLTNQKFPAHGAQHSDASPVAEALEYLEDGQVTEARNLLEKQLMASPDDVAATRLLLDIYRRARDQHALTAMRSRLDPLPDLVRPLWNEAAAFFARQV